MAKYDSGLKYDSSCPVCSQFNLEIVDPNGKLAILETMGDDPVVEAMILRLIGYLTPLNAKLNTITYTGQ